MEIEKNYHRVILTVEDALAALLSGKEIDNWLIDDVTEVDKFKAAASYFDSMDAIEYPERLAITPEEFHAKNREAWLMPDKYFDIDLYQFLYSRCNPKDHEQIARVTNEMKLYSKYNLETLLKFMIYLVDVFRENNITWGIGRGSSVSSYVLYLIGIHKVDSIRYDLDIKDFLRS